MFLYLVGPYLALSQRPLILHWPLRCQIEDNLRSNSHRQTPNAGPNNTERSKLTPIEANKVQILLHKVSQASVLLWNHFNML